MSGRLDQILAGAMGLAPAERARLAASLISSLDGEFDREADSEWRAEVRRRLDELDSGKVVAIDWMEAREQILR